MFLVQRLHAPHDVNGNPRRVYAVYNIAGGMYGVYDEGYNGLNVLPEYILNDTSHRLPDLDITVRQYKVLLENYGR